MPTSTEGGTRTDPAQTEEQLRLAIRSSPADAALHARLADLLSEGDRHAEAYTAYSEAARLDPRRPEYRYGSGSAALALGRLAEAETQFAWGGQLDPADPAMQVGLGKAALARGHPELAAPHFRRAIELSDSASAVQAEARALLLEATQASSNLSDQGLPGMVRQGLLYAALATMSVAGLAMALPVAEGLMLLFLMTPIAALRKRKEGG